MSAGRIIGVGQPLAGDDAVGLAVIAHLRAQRIADIGLDQVADATALIALLVDGAPVVLVDGVIGIPVGYARQLALDALDGRDPFRASSHGFGVRQAIALAQALSPDLCVRLVGVGIANVKAFEPRLSAQVAAAVPNAAALAVALARDLRSRSGSDREVSMALRLPKPPGPTL
jgi:hydrogenase maturation protease